MPPSEPQLISSILASPLACDLDAQRVTLQAILDHSPADICLKDLKGRYLLVNRNFCLRTGLEGNSIVGKTAQDIFAKREADLCEAHDREVLEQLRPMQFEEVMPLGDGPHSFLVEKFPLRNREGEVYAVCSIGSDITRRKKQEHQLQQLNLHIQQQGRTLETVLSSAPSMVLLLDPKGRFLYANKPGAQLFGKRAVDLIGLQWEDVPAAADFFVVLADEVAQVRKTGASARGDLSVPTPDGPSEYAYHLIPNMDMKGMVVQVIVYLRDVTADRQKDRMLKRQAQDLVRANKELDQFARIASHDLNEPLRMVQSYLMLLDERMGAQLDDKCRDYLDFALDGASRMKGLIGDLLEYSRIGTGREKHEEIVLGDMLEQVKADLALAIEEKQAEVSWGRLPRVWGIPHQIHQLLSNLVGNALKYNESRPARVHFSVEQKNDVYVFELRDNGIGIDPRFGDRIFRIFQRLHGRNEYSGTGMGLAICRKILIQHDGDIWVKSEPGQGSSFFFSLPVRYKGSYQMMMQLFADLEDV